MSGSDSPVKGYNLGIDVGLGSKNSYEEYGPIQSEADRYKGKIGEIKATVDLVLYGKKVSRKDFSEEGAEEIRQLDIMKSILDNDLGMGKADEARTLLDETYDKAQQDALINRRQNLMQQYDLNETRELLKTVRAKYAEVQDKEYVEAVDKLIVFINRLQQSRHSEQLLNQNPPVAA